MVKINEKIINLANLDEVVALLQAAVNKYDEDKEYQVELQLDPTREPWAAKPFFTLTSILHT